MGISILKPSEQELKFFSKESSQNESPTEEASQCESSSEDPSQNESFYEKLSQKESPIEKLSQKKSSPCVEVENEINSEEVEVIKTISVSSKEAKSQITAPNEKVINSENLKNTGKIEQNFLWLTQKLALLFFGSQSQPSLKVKENVSGSNTSNKSNSRPNQQIPPPPSYYSQRISTTNNYPYGFSPGFTLIHFNPNFWSPYPSSVPHNTPPQLAQLIDVDTLFIVNNLEILSFVTNIELPHTYLVQNSRGQCIYFASEIFSNFTFCLGSSRGMKFIFRDVYENEVIYMNKYCGCSCPCLFCCYPVMEVYSPPSHPLGAIIRVCQSPRDDFIIVDANENKIFNIRGSVMGNVCGPVCTLEYSIHSLDRNNTIVGRIKRQSVNFSTYYFSSEIYGVSFLSNLDVRMKTVFLGALLLIQLT